MIERIEISGRMATVCYLTEDFQPADKDSSTLLKVRFDDGEVAFMTLAEDGDAWRKKD